MNDAPSEIALQSLFDKSLVSLPSASGEWPCFVSSMADVPSMLDNCLAVYDEEPVKDGRLMHDGTVILHHVVSVRLRANAYSVGWAKIESIATALDAMHDVNVTLGSNSYTLNNASRQSGVNALGLEAGTQRRFIFELRYALTLTSL